MMPTMYAMPEPGARQTFTGERYTTGTPGNIQNEHYHRYLFALRFCAGKDVLDVASGEGYGSALISTVANSVVGVDIDAPTVAFATRAYARGNLDFRLGSATSLPLDDASVDVVVSFETIEHITAHDDFLREVKRVLRANGSFIVSTPDRKTYSEEPGYKNPFHLKELSRAEFEALLCADFAHVRMFEQQVLAGSVIATTAQESGGAESFATTDGSNFAYRPRLPYAPYLIAVATAAAAALPGLSVLHGLWINEIGDVAGLKQQVMELDRERGFLRAMLTNARRLTDHAREESISARATVEAEVAAARGMVDEAHAAAAAQIEAIHRSTSWRLTRPLRSVSILARRILR